MDQIYDKAMLLFCGLVLTLVTSLQFQAVILFLCAIILLAIDELMPDRFPSLPVFLVFIILSFPFQGMIFFLPCFAYLIFVRKRNPLVLSFLIPFLYHLTNHDNSGELVLPLLVYLLALLLSDRQRKTLTLRNELNRQRDDDMEKQIILQKQAQALQENQDNRIKIATLQERTRIAREIHDNVGHLLSRSLLQIGALQTIHKDDEALSSLRESLDLAMNGIRSSVHNLRDEAVDLESSIKLLLESYNGYHSSFLFEVGSTVPINITYCFLTILKEALTNITKHSNGDSIRISVKEFPALFQLMISDNGTNASTSSETNGMGLQNMKDRVAANNGILRFSTNDGFHIFVSIPKEMKAER